MRVGANGFASIHASVIESRIKKLFLFLDRKSFLNQLVYEIEKARINK